MGRPAHKPDDKSVGYVKAMASYGVPQEEIADALGISEPTLRKHYGKVIKRAAIEANARVGEALFRQAAGAPAQFDEDGNQIREEMSPVPSVSIFWAKCRMRWSQTAKVELSGPQGGPIPVLDPAKLRGATDAELEVLERFIGRLQRGDDSDPGGEAAAPDENDYASSIDNGEG